MWGVLVGWLGGAVFGVGLLAWRVPTFHWSTLRAALSQVPTAIRFGGPLQVAAVLGTANIHVDKILLARYAGLASVVPYELGSRVTTTILTFPQLMLGPVLSEAVQLHVEGADARLRELHDRAMNYYLGATVLLLVPLLACADRILGTWLATPHPEAALVLRWVAIQSGIALSAGMATTIARAMGNTRLEAMYAVIAVSIHVGLSVILIPRFGILGALGSIVIGSIVGVTYFMTAFLRLTRWPWSSVLRAGVIPTAVLIVAALAGAAIDARLPQVPGVRGWLWLAASVAIAVGMASAALVVTRYLKWHEALSVLDRAFRTGRRPA
jgi:O-antigen/teichoic acid export membrane protein